MSYQFKVGDKGKTQRGTNYEVIGIEPRATVFSQLIVLLDSETVKGDKFITTRSMDGKYSNGNSYNYDLLPPTKTVWEVSFERIDPKGGQPFKSVHIYDNECHARDMLTTYQSEGHRPYLKNVTITSREVQSE